MKEITKPVPPNKQRTMPKIRQSSPLKLRSSKVASESDRRNTTSTIKDDKIDIEIDCTQKQQAKELQSDPSVKFAGRNLRKDRKRNYFEMLQGDKYFRQTEEDEIAEIRMKNMI